MNLRRLGPKLRVQAALDDPEQRLVRPRVGRQRALRPAVRPGRRVGDDRTRRRRHDRLVERDRDVGAERLLDRDRVLRREAMGRAVDVAAERHAVLVDDPQVAERHDLEPARVGEDRPVPGHEPVQPAEPLDALVAGAQVQVVRVGEDDRGAGRGDLVGVERLDRGVRADRHELGRLDDAVRQLESPDPGARRSVRRRRDLDREPCGAWHLSAGSAGRARPTRRPTPAASSRAGRRS